MSDFVRVAKVSDFTDPSKRIVEVADRVVVVLLVDGQFYCIDDVCTHDGGTLGEGELCSHALACPRHGAKFDIRTGAALTMPATEPTVVHEVRVEGENVLVRVKAD